MDRDPLKIFFGQLNPELLKWQFLEWMEEQGHPKPVDVFMKPPKAAGQLQCAFAVYSDEGEAMAATGAHGSTDAQVTPSMLQAQLGQHGSLSMSLEVRSLEVRSLEVRSRLKILPKDFA